MGFQVTGLPSLTFWTSTGLSLLKHHRWRLGWVLTVKLQLSAPLSSWNVWSWHTGCRCCLPYGFCWSFTPLVSLVIAHVDIVSRQVLLALGLAAAAALLVWVLSQDTVPSVGQGELLLLQAWKSPECDTVTEDSVLATAGTCGNALGFNFTLDALFSGLTLGELHEKELK